VPPSGGSAGGCEFYVRNGEPTLLLLVQANSDVVYEIGGRFQYGSGCGGVIALANDAPFRGNSAWTVRLERSRAGAGVLLLGAGPDMVPMPTPLFGPNCVLLVSLAMPTVFLPPVPVVAGAAQQRVPIPLQLPAATISFQWLEVVLPLAPPAFLSNGGRCHVGL
jgi:hypothetical protein